VLRDCVEHFTSASSAFTLESESPVFVESVVGLESAVLFLALFFMFFFAFVLLFAEVCRDVSVFGVSVLVVSDLGASGSGVF